MFEERLEVEFLLKTKVKRAIEAEPFKSLRKHATDLGVVPFLMLTTARNMGWKSLERVEREMMTPGIRETHQQHCQGPLNNLKFAKEEKRPPYFPNANPLEFAFWPHVENKA